MKGGSLRTGGRERMHTRSLRAQDGGESMSQQLREAMLDLAAHAPSVARPDETAARTWRRARRVRAAAAAAAVCVVLAVLAGIIASAGVITLHESAPEVSQPYDPAKLALPDKVWRPSPWTSGTDEDGPLGPLALIATAP